MSKITDLVGTNIPQNLTAQLPGGAFKELENINADTNIAAIASYLYQTGQVYNRAIVTDVLYTTSTTLTTIATFPSLPVGSTWYVSGVLILTTGGTGGLKIALSQDTDALLAATLLNLTVDIATSATATAMANATAVGTAAGASSGGAITGLPAYFSGYITVSTAGRLAIQTAQNSSNSTSTVKAGSFISLIQVVQ